LYNKAAGCGTSKGHQLPEGNIKKMGPCPYLSSIQRAYAILCCRPWLGRPYIFPHHPINGSISGKEVTESETSVMNFSASFLVLRRIQVDTITNVQRSSCKLSVILVRVLSALNFLRHIFEKKKKTLKNQV
jgi:hypothetical protein